MSGTVHIDAQDERDADRWSHEPWTRPPHGARNCGAVRTLADWHRARLVRCATCGYVMVRGEAIARLAAVRTGHGNTCDPCFFERPHRGPTRQETAVLKLLGW